jgi:SAM-dependent methyltransferase
VITPQKAPDAVTEQAPAPAGWPAASTREIDLRYLGRPPATSYRPYFSFVEGFARDLLQSHGPVPVLDIGCANGSFVHYLTQRHPAARCTGVDALPQLVEDAARNVPAGTFAVGDIREAKSMPAGPFSLVTMLTLHSHFDRLDAVLDNVMSLVGAGGRALVFGPFNRSAADVLVRVRVAGTAAGWQPGWNLHSRQAVDGLLGSRGYGTTYHDYEPPQDWTERHGDPLGTRKADINGKATFINDAGLILPFALLEVRR